MEAREPYARPQAPPSAPQHDTNPYRAPRATGEGERPPQQAARWGWAVAWGVLLANGGLLLAIPFLGPLNATWRSVLSHWLTWGLPVSAGAACFWVLLSTHVSIKSPWRYRYFLAVIALMTLWGLTLVQFAVQVLTNVR